MAEKYIEKNLPKLGPEVSKIFDFAISKNASDVHFSLKSKPIIRVDGKLYSIESEKVLNLELLTNLVDSILTEDLKKRLQKEKQVDFSFSYADKVRFRVNIFYEKGTIAAALRMIPTKIRTIEDLGLPPILEKFATAAQGLFIVTGPTGHGKSTTLAAIVDYINKTRSDHIITLEDPIEYVFENNKSLIQQREVYNDASSFAEGLKSTLREDPNVVLVGEMRDPESISMALTVAETGHLVLATLHANNAAETVDRIIDVFPPHQQQQARFQLANVMLGVISQRLIPKQGGGRIAAAEIMVATTGVRNVIREAKTYQLFNIINTSMSDGMISIDRVLADLVSRGEIAIDDALVWAQDPKALKMSIY
jgi:twitching motility protein PilT